MLSKHEIMFVFRILLLSFLRKYDVRNFWPLVILKTSSILFLSFCDPKRMLSKRRKFPNPKVDILHNHQLEKVLKSIQIPKM